MATSVFFLTFAFGVSAEESRISVKPDEEATLQLKLQKTKPLRKKQFDNHFEYQFNQYQSSGKRFFREGADTSQSEWTLGLKTHPGVSGGGFDIINTYQEIEGANYFKPAEVYYKFRPFESGDLFLGRKLIPWSRADRMWKRGLFESRFMDSPLTSRPSGLTGLFLASNQKQDRGWVIFASPLYIPELGPRVSTVDGKLVSSNPWFRPPSGIIRLNDEEVEMNYSIKKPDIEEVIFHSSYGISYKWSHEDSPWSARASYTYKPMNQLMMSVPFVLNLGENAEDIEVEADVIPTVNYHHMTSLMVEAKLAPRWAVWSEWMYERPELASVDDKSISQNMNRSHNYTITLERRPQSVGSKMATQYWLSYSKLIGGDTTDRGEFASGDDSLFERRFLFHEAVQLGLRTYLGKPLGLPLLWKVSTTYDEKQKGGILSTEFNLFSGPRFQWNVTADWIGKLQRDSEIVNGFTGQFRANDRYGMGAIYVF